jgi:hypothetical protein
VTPGAKAASKRLTATCDPARGLNKVAGRRQLRKQLRSDDRKAAAQAAQA